MPCVLFATKASVRGCSYDELTDTISNQTVLSLCIRLKHDNQITTIGESFISFAYIEEEQVLA